MNPLLQKLTIAIPVYNDEAYIGAAIESCLTEAGRIVIYDNASTDRTAEIAQIYSDKHAHVHYIRHAENIGAFDNFKSGLDACETEYFCWVGSHDILDKGYSLPLLTALDNDQTIALAAGTITHIDENAKPTGHKTESHWANNSKDNNALERVGACVTGLRKDCSIFYAIYRTSILRQVWVNTPCLGFDRALLAKTAAAGKIVYIPQSIFFARNLDSSRNSKTDRERRSQVVGSKPIAKNVFMRNKMMVEAVLSQAHTPEELSRALYFIDKINRRYQNRRFYQKMRLIKIAAAVIIIGLFILALVY